MGYFRHHVIIVTSPAETLAPYIPWPSRFRRRCERLIDSRANGYRSFLVAQDGSKEGWDASVVCDRRRAVHRAAHSATAGKPMEPAHWVQIEFGDHKYAIT
jgi:hypothetical protein